MKTFKLFRRKSVPRFERELRKRDFELSCNKETALISVIRRGRQLAPGQRLAQKRRNIE